MQTVRSSPVHVSKTRSTAADAGSAALPKRWLSTGGIYVLLLALAVLFAGPFAWLMRPALKPRDEWVAVPPHILPSHAQWSNFTHALTDINSPAYTINSLFLSTIYAVLVTLSSAA